MTFDWTINLGEVLLVGGGIVAFLKVFLSMRDSHVEVVRVLGKEEPPSGVVGDVKHIRIEQQEHREWLIRAGLDK